MISARIGRTTGHGLAGVLRLHYPNWLLQIIVLLLLVANVINLGADLGAMADASRLLLPAPTWPFLLFFAGVCVFMQVLLQYTRYVSVLKWLTLALFSASHVDWRQCLLGLIVPRLGLNKDAVTMIVAIFGTTISPYLFFWQSAEEVEDIEAFPRRHDLLDAPEQGKSVLHRIETH